MLLNEKDLIESIYLRSPKKYRRKVRNNQHPVLFQMANELLKDIKISFINAEVKEKISTHITKNISSLVLKIIFIYLFIYAQNLLAGLL